MDEHNEQSQPTALTDQPTNTTPPVEPKPADNKCRFGLFSRIEFGSDGFRQALLNLAKDTLAADDVHFVVLAGGLISAKDIKARRKELGRRINTTKRELRALVARNKRLSKERTANAKQQTAKITEITAKAKQLQLNLEALSDTTAADERQALATKLDVAQRELTKARSTNQSRETRRAKTELDESEEIDQLEQTLTALAREVKLLEPEAMAEQLARVLPIFTNAAGEPVNLFIIPSPAIDNDIGDETAHLLANLRNDIRVYSSGNDRLHLKQAGKVVEVLTPKKKSWRSDYQSTPPERLLKDRRKQSALGLPDFWIVGGFGSAILNPQGKWPRPYITAPVLHCLRETDTSENQIGVRVVSVHPNHTVPVAYNYNFKDHVNAERLFIGTPKRMTAVRTAIIGCLKTTGPTTTSILAEATGLSADEVKVELQGLVITDRNVRKTWPGLIFEAESHRWDFDQEWVRTYLIYPPLPPTKKRKTDSIVAYGCLHAGSINTDYRFFLDKIPQIVLDRNATVLVGAGDFVQGLKHNLQLRGETIGGMNVTDMEHFAGALIAQVNITVFRVRFAAAFNRLIASLNGRPPTPAEIQQLINDSLLLNLMIMGNHDLWAQDGGTTPLDSMQSEMVFRLVGAIEEELTQRSLCLPGLNNLIKSRVLILSDGRYTLPSNLRLAILHPHMASAQTSSLRPQSMLEFARDCQVVIGANFHVAEHIDLWESPLGQRTCLEVGTVMHRTQFEDTKLKIVDQGFGALHIESAAGRIIKTEATFYENDPARAVPIDGQLPMRIILEQLGIRPN